MKKLVALIFVMVCLNARGADWQITNSGNTFTPATITIRQGDNVTFAITNFHDAVEVSQTVWNANGNSPVIGFSVPYGGGKVPASALTVGTHYYVCTPHASMGMKGKIIVEASSDLPQQHVNDSVWVYPNPVSDFLCVRVGLPVPDRIEIKLLDLRGKELVDLLPEKWMPASGEIRCFIKHKVASGFYVLQTTIGGKKYNKKLLVL